MKSRIELHADEAALIIDVNGKMGIEMPKLKPEDENDSLPTHLQLVAGMFLAMQRQNEKVVSDFLEFCMGVFDEEMDRDDDAAATGGVRNDPAAGQQVDEQGAA